MYYIDANGMIIMVDKNDKIFEEKNFNFLKGL